MKIKRKRKIIYIGSGIMLLGIIVGFKDKAVDLLQGKTESPYEIESCGVERWDVKVLSDTGAVNVNIIPVNTTISTLVHLPTPATINPDWERQPNEKQLYTIHCTVDKIKLESDGDYHIDVEDSFGNFMITEIPDPTCPATASSLYLGDIIKCRKFIDAHYNITTSFQTINQRFVISGVGFMDPPHGQDDAAPNNLELHSVLDIEFEPVHNSGIDEAAHQNQSINVFPNPFADNAMFRLDVASAKVHKNGILKIYDLNGEEIKSIAWPETEGMVVLHRDNMPHGIYIYRLIEDESDVATGKIMAD